MRSWLRTFLYYLVAFGGALVWGGTYYLHKQFTERAAGDPGDPYYMIVYIFPILQNVVPQTLAAVILRKLARRMTWTKMWQWLLAGSVVSLLLVYAFAQAGEAIERTRFSLEFQRVKGLLLALVGPMMVFTKPLWLAVVAVAVTSLALWVVQHGFGKPGVSATDKH